LERNLPVFQPEKVRDGRLRDWLADYRADVALVLAYGRILPPDVLATPRQGCLNLHASLLPRHRGAAPIQWALMAGDEETGISLMRMDEGLDTGPVFTRHSLKILENDDTGSLTIRLAQLAADVVLSDLARVVDGQLQSVPQDEALTTWAPPLKHEDQSVDFAQTAIQILGKIRGLSPKPGAVTTLRGKRLKLLEGRVSAEPVNGPPGTVTLTKRSICVATGAGAVELLRLQLEGKAVQAAADLINGRAIASGDSLGTTSPAMS
jgi:methionyl-tRNA formyltransferase